MSLRASTDRQAAWVADDDADRAATAGGLAFDAEAQSSDLAMSDNEAAVPGSTVAALQAEHDPAGRLVELERLLAESSSASRGRSREAVQLWAAAAAVGAGGGATPEATLAAGEMHGADVAKAVAELRRLMRP